VITVRAHSPGIRIGAIIADQRRLPYNIAFSLAALLGASTKEL